MGSWKTSRVPQTDAIIRFEFTLTEFLHPSYARE